MNFGCGHGHGSRTWQKFFPFFLSTIVSSHPAGPAVLPQALGMERMLVSWFRARYLSTTITRIRSTIFERRRRRRRKKEWISRMRFREAGNILLSLSLSLSPQLMRERERDSIVVKNAFARARGAVLFLLSSFFFSLPLSFFFLIFQKANRLNR